MASPSELILECKPPQSLTLLKPNFGEAAAAGVHDNNSPSNGHPQPQQVSSMIIDGNISGTTQKLEEYLSRLEEERLKIDAFKRELPLCMQLLCNAMEVSRQQLLSSNRSSPSSSIITQKPRPVLEEFIPINKHHQSSNLEPDNMTTTTTSSDQNKTPKTTDKSNWMISAQLWSNTNEQQGHDHQSSSDQIRPRLTLLDVNGDAAGRSFLPLTKGHQTHHRHTGSLPNLALSPNGGEIGDDKKLCLAIQNGLGSENGSKGFMVSKPDDGQTSTTSGNGAGTTTTTSQTQRKQRRCWSPDLHRRFVNALQMLGGSQVATPKQIRELMKVDGLTNDEVKSHLQKYRLHTRRPGPISPQSSGHTAPQLVVLGGIWVPPEYAAHHHHHGHGTPPPTIYSTHHPTSQVAPPPSHYACSPQEFYQGQPPQPPLLQQLQFHQHHPTAAAHHIQQLPGYSTRPPSGRYPVAQSSPETEERGVSRERSVSTEDGRSGSSDWKNGGLESGGEERTKNNIVRRISSREGDDESNGSEITLKF